MQTNRRGSPAGFVSNAFIGFRRFKVPTSAPSVRSEWPLRLDSIMTDALEAGPPQNHEDRSKYVLSLQIKTLSVRERFAAQ